MTRDQMFAIVGRRYNLDFTTTTGQDYLDMVRSAQEGVYEVLKAVPFTKAQLLTYTPGAVAGLSVLSQAWLTLLDIKRNSDGLPLERKTKREMDYLQRTGSVTGSATAYYSFDYNWLHFFPTPGASDTFTVDYVPVPTALAAGDDPATDTRGGIPLEYQNIIVEWMLMRAAEYAGDPARAEYHEKRFDQKIARARNAGHRKGGRIGRIQRVGYPNRGGTLGRSNDTYP